MRFSAIGRLLDPRLPSHRNAFLISATAGTVAWGTAGFGWSDGLSAAFNAGVGTFLAWAIARELDPDRPRSAVLSAIFAGTVIVLVGEALLLPTTVALVTTRILHRSTGLAPTVFDLIALPAVAFVAGTSIIGWSTGLALAFAVARDHRLPNPAPRRQLVASFVIAAAATAAAAVNGPAWSWTAPSLSQWFVLTAGLIAGASLRIYTPRSMADFTNSPLEAKRLQSARVGTIGTGLLAFLVTGGSGIVGLSPAWAALAGVAVWDRLGSDGVDHLATE